MAALIKKQSRPTRLRKIDLSDRRAAGPVAAQHGVRGIPMLVLYDGTREVTRDLAKVMAELARHMKE